MVTRGDIWLVTLDPTVGTEIQKTRPCVVISPSDLHDHLRTVLIAPMTTKGRPAGFRIPVTFGEPGLVLLDQMRAIDKQRMIRKLGTLDAAVLNETLRVLRNMFEF